MFFVRIGPVLQLEIRKVFLGNGVFFVETLVLIESQPFRRIRKIHCIIMIYGAIAVQSCETVDGIIEINECICFVNYILCIQSIIA